MTGSLYLAWRYLLFHPFKTVILISSITLIIYLPIGLQVLVTRSAEQLTSRAEATPLIVGARGSPIELVLNTLYFDSDRPEEMLHEQVTRIEDSGLALPIPLHVRFRSPGDRGDPDAPIVGTTLSYFDFRGLRVESGRNMAVLGDCVLGAAVARKRGIGPGGFVVSSPETVFDLAGVYPLKMTVVGVLAPSHGPDDHVVFVDLKTAWIIQGLGHGHQDLEDRSASKAVLSREGNRIIANASVDQIDEITDANRESFHFHGDPENYPITAIIAVPPDEKSGVLLTGRYLGEGETCQIVIPARVMNELLSTILTVRSFVVAAVVLVGLSTLATAVLVFLLSLRLRRREVETMVKIGGSRLSVVWVLTSEVVVVLVSSALLAGGLTCLTHWFGSAAIRSLFLS